MSKIIFILYILFSFQPQCREEIFVNGIEELPVIKNMQNMPESLIYFDTNKGRFVQSKIVGNQSISQIKDFYENILPNLGWEKIDKNKFSRKSELMEIRYYKYNKDSIAEFNIKPK